MCLYLYRQEKFQHVHATKYLGDPREHVHQLHDQFCMHLLFHALAISQRDMQKEQVSTRHVSHCRVTADFLALWKRQGPKLKYRLHQLVQAGPQAQIPDG